jgi:hypothetical protein
VRLRILLKCRHRQPMYSYSCYASRSSQDDEVSRTPSGLAGSDRGRRHSDRWFALFCGRGSVACRHAPRCRRRRDSYAASGLALGLSAWARFGADSGPRSISHLDRRGFLRDQPESPARSRVEIVEASPLSTRLGNLTTLRLVYNECGIQAFVTSAKLIRSCNDHAGFCTGLLSSANDQHELFDNVADFPSQR